MTTEQLPANTAGLPLTEQLRRQLAETTNERNDAYAELDHVEAALNRTGINGPGNYGDRIDATAEALARLRRERAEALDCRDVVRAELDALKLSWTAVDTERMRWHHLASTAADSRNQLLGDLDAMTRTIQRLTNQLDDAQQATTYPATGTHPDTDISAFLANISRSLQSARNDDERAEAVEMLLSGWYAAWPKTALTDPHEALAGELVRLLRPAPDARLGSGPARAQVTQSGQFCHAHFSWLCQAGQGQCQAATPRPADWEQKAIDAVHTAIADAWPHPFPDIDARVAVRALVDANLVDPGPGGAEPAPTADPERDATLHQIATETDQLQADIAAGRLVDQLGPPRRAACCECDPVACAADDTGDHCNTRGCAYCVHGCPASPDQTCCKASAPEVPAAGQEG